MLRMGLKTAPTAYQRMVASCIDEFTRKYGTKPYIDHLMHGTIDPDTGQGDAASDRCIEQHFQELDVFSILAHRKLTLKLEKCTMFATRVKFCGHILTPQGRVRDPEKVQAIK